MEYEELSKTAKDDVLQRIESNDVVPHEYVIYVPEEIFEGWLKDVWGVAHTGKTAEPLYGLSNGMFPFDLDSSMEIEDGYRVERT